MLTKATGVKMSVCVCVWVKAQTSHDPVPDGPMKGVKTVEKLNRMQCGQSAPHWRSVQRTKSKTSRMCV